MRCGCAWDLSGHRRGQRVAKISAAQVSTATETGSTSYPDDSKLQTWRINMKDIGKLTGLVALNMILALMGTP